MRRLVVPLVAALMLTGCAGTANPEPDKTDDPMTRAMELCIWAHPATGEYAAESGTGRTPAGEGEQVTQTARGSCDRWRNKVGDAEFTQQWTQDYAEHYKQAFGD